MPIKVKLVDNSSETKVGVGDGAAIHLFKEALKRETKERTEADEHLQEEIDNLTAGSAAYLLITENENGSIEVSILNSKEEVLDTKTITLTEKLIRNIDFDYETCQLIFTYFDGTTSTCSLNEIKEALLAEIERAKAAEQELIDNLNQEIQARIAEEARAKEAEAELDEKIEAEAARAFAAEQVLDNKIETETERAEGAEANLNARINALDLSEVGSDGSYIKTISQEDGQVSATRQAFDTTLEGADDTNAPTSKAVKDYIDAETSRAEDKEAELEQAISDEESRAEREEEAINTRIDSLDLSEVGAAGSYIKLVSQAEGQVSATAQAFDTDVLDNTEDNAPTTKAVKDYVDTYGGKIDTVTIDGDYLPIDENKNIEIPTVRTDISNQELSSTQKNNAKTNLDLENVDNTADLDKPISTATQAALDLKADDNTVVHFAGIETITGPKTFTNENGIVIGSSRQITLQSTASEGLTLRDHNTGAGIKAGYISGVGPVVKSYASNTSLGDNSSKWRDLYLADGIYGNQGRKDIDLSGGGIALGSELYTLLLRPRTNNASDLGTTDFKYKDLYLSGQVNLGTTDTAIKTDQYGNLRFRRNGEDKVALASALQPTSDGSLDLGVSSIRWGNLYLKESLSDGTNSTTVENIVTKTGDQTITGTKIFKQVGTRFTNSSDVGWTIKAQDSGYLGMYNNNSSLVYSFENNFIPNSSADLGNSSKKWKDAYFSGTVNADTFIGKIKSSYSNRTLTFGTDDFNINFPNTIFAGKFKTGANDSYGLSVPSTSSLTENKTIAVTTDITDAINALDVASVGEDGYYLKTIVEADGLITATKEQFDRSIDNNSSHNNIPSSQAVREFVNSSVSTNTANFLGTFTSVSLLPTTGVTNNDYAFVTNSVLPTDYQNFAALDAVNKATLTNYDYGWVINAEDNTKFDLYRFNQEQQAWELRVSKTDKADVALNDAYNRYKYNSSNSSWVFEYTLNNSSFTAAQWAAINSTINADKVSRIVYADTDQTISGVKTFTDNIIISKASAYPYLRLINTYGNHDIEAFGYDTRIKNTLFVMGHIYPNSTNSYTLGKSDLRWKDLYLAGRVNPNSSSKGLLFPDTALFTEDKTLVTEDRVNELASNKADKVTSATANDLAGLDSTGNLTDSGIAISDVALQSGNNVFTGDNTFYTNNGLKYITLSGGSGTIAAKITSNNSGHLIFNDKISITGSYLRPLADDIDIGSSTYGKFRDLYLSGIAYTNKVQSTGSQFLVNIGANTDFAFEHLVFRPAGNGNTDLGTNVARWKDLYLNGKISDGTNSTTVANINNNIAPTYDATATYAIGDRVIYEGRLYKCTTAITTAEAWDSTHWLAINLTDSTNGFVTLDTTQTISGSKTFTNTIGSNVANGSNVLSTNTNWTINKDSNGKINIGQPNNDIRFYDTDIRFNTTLIRPQVTDTTNLGNSDYKFKELYLSGSAFIGQSLRLTYSGSYQISKRGDDGITVANTANNKGIRIMGQGVDALVPNVANYSLGTSTDTWKDEWLSGKQYFAYNTDSYTPTERNWNIYHNQYNELVFARTYNSVDQEKIKFNGGSIYTEDANGNLGSSSKKWKDLYLSGQVYLNGTQLLYDSGWNQLRIADNSGNLKYALGLGGSTDAYKQSLYAYDHETSLGNSTYQFKNAYISGNLSDGTNSIAVANIQEKVTVRRFI